MMQTLKKLGVVSVMLVSLAACSNLNKQEQRTLSGGALGAVGGAVVGALTGSWVAGALIGGAGGAAVGALTSEKEISVRK